MLIPVQSRSSLSGFGASAVPGIAQAAVSVVGAAVPVVGWASMAINMLAGVMFNKKDPYVIELLRLIGIRKNAWTKNAKLRSQVMQVKNLERREMGLKPLAEGTATYQQVMDAEFEKRDAPYRVADYMVVYGKVPDGFRNALGPERADAAIALAKSLRSDARITKAPAAKAVAAVAPAAVKAPMSLSITNPIIPGIVGSPPPPAPPKPAAKKVLAAAVVVDSKTIAIVGGGILVTALLALALVPRR